MCQNFVWTHYLFLQVQSFFFLDIYNNACLTPLNVIILYSMCLSEGWKSDFYVEYFFTHMSISFLISGGFGCET